MSRVPVNKFKLMSQNNPYEQPSDRGFGYQLKDDSSRRSQAFDASIRGRSKEIIKPAAQRSKTPVIGGHGGGTEKSIISMWGYTSGLGLESSAETIGELDEELSDLSFSDGHVVLLTQGNKVLVRGKNDSKQLGFDSKETLNSFKMLSLPPTVRFVRVECGGDYTFALGREGEVFSWGLNIKGQLGHGHFEPVASAAQLRYLSYSADSRSPRVSRRSKDNNDEVKLTPGEKVIDVSCGALHSILQTNKGRLFACGYGETHALGLPHRENQCTFCEVPFFSSGEFFEKSISKIATGISHSACIVNDCAYIWGIWGSQAEMVHSVPTLVPVMSPMQGFGNAVPEQIVDVKLGDLLTVFLTSKGEIYTMGDNINGQLGLGEQTKSATVPTKVQIDVPVSGLSCGSNHVYCFTRGCEHVYSWGSNMKGQIIPNSTQSKISTVTKIYNLVDALTLKIVCSSRATIGVSRLPIEFPPREEPKQQQQHTQNTEALKKLELALFAEKNEKDNYKKANAIVATESAQLKQEIMQLKAALQQADRIPKKTFSSNASTQTQDDSEEGGGQFDVMQHFKKKLPENRTLRPCFEIDFGELVMEKQIGEGGFGLIYRARWRETTVAVKVLKPDLMREETIKDFLNECYAMESLRHPNIVMFMGACTKLPNLAIVLEYCSRKSLWNLLQNLDYKLNWEDRRRLALEIARGMNYLHMFPTPVLHRDLKSLNILIDDGFRPKIADFGWTRLKAENMTGKIGTYQWMAPEVIKSQKYTEMADVFSFGIILWEIAAREPPYRNINGVQVSLEVVNNDMRPKIPDNTPEAFAKLMKRCWDRQPTSRPTFNDVIRELENMKLPVNSRPA